MTEIISQTETEMVLGQILMLMMDSPQHKYMFISDLDWILRPPLQLRQFRLYRQDDRPRSYISWGFLSPEVENRLLKEDSRLRPHDWTSGNRIWLIDIISPYQGAEFFINDIAKTVFTDQDIHYTEIMNGATNHRTINSKDFN